MMKAPDVPVIAELTVLVRPDGRVECNQNIIGNVNELAIFLQNPVPCSDILEKFSLTPQELSAVTSKLKE